MSEHKAVHPPTSTNPVLPIELMIGDEMGSLWVGKFHSAGYNFLLDL